MKCLRTNFIVFHPIRHIMLASIDLYDKLCTRAIEIHDVISYNSLTIKFDRIRSKEIKPQMSFLICHIAS